MWTKILEELSQQNVKIDDASLAYVKQAKRVFLFGAGRSGLALKSFAMRLSQMGKVAFVVGETTTPSIGQGDLLIVASSSVTTPQTRNFAEKALAAGSDVWLLTTDTVSPISEIASHVTHLPGKNKFADGTAATKQSMGSLFEQAVWLFGDAFVLSYMASEGITEQFMKEQHANLE